VTRSTIDYGIDLGTTNSAAALLEGTQTRVIRNISGIEYTPSAVRLGPNGELVVGAIAKGRAGSDPGNVFTSFKRAMGTPDEFHFARDGRIMRAEDLSAEVLKVIKADITRATGEVPSAAVITVPAAFDQPQCAATKLAAQKAGWEQSPLLQEPVAASLAYGFQDATENVFWLVFDLGGGTFDAAVVTMREGVFQVVNHLGDNHLGGSDIDRAIVDDLLIPALSSEYGVSVDRSSPKWIGALATLENAAEEAKIAVSQLEAASIQIDEIKDSGGTVVEDFIFDLSRRDVERLMEPRLERTLDLSRRVLSEKGLDVDDLEKIILVGGPTLAPITRERIGGLGASVSERLEFHMNPLTVVACGAAVFAGTQRLDASTMPAPAAGSYRARLEYKPIGADTEPLVGGVVEAPDGGDLSGFTVEFANLESKPQWRSGRIALAANGSFMTNLWAEKGRANTFTLELVDGRGAPQKVDPEQFTYTVGNVFSDVPLPHNGGVALADNSVAEFFRKGDALPARGRLTLHTAYDARAGGSSTVRISFIEGLSPRADRNADFGSIEIREDELTRNVPAGSEVEVTLEIDASRNVRAEVYIPLLDETFEATYGFDNYREKARDTAGLKAQVAKQKARWDQLREQADETGDAGAREALGQIDAQHLVQQVDGAAAAMETDQAAAGRCEQSLRDLQQALDGAEDALRWPALMADAEDAIKFGQKVIDDFGEADDESRYERLRDHVREAMRSSDEALLEQRVEELKGLIYGILDERGILQMWWLDALKERSGEMGDQARAGQLIARADRAIQMGDIEGLRAANRQLAQLLPSPPPPPDGSWLLR